VLGCLCIKVAETKWAWNCSAPFHQIGSYEPPPTSCKVVQVNQLQRHGSRYPTAKVNKRIQRAIRKLRQASHLHESISFLTKYQLSLDGPFGTSILAAGRSWPDHLFSCFTGTAWAKTRYFLSGPPKASMQGSNWPPAIPTSSIPNIFRSFALVHPSESSTAHTIFHPDSPPTLAYHFTPSNPSSFRKITM
jgi:hypothetical protein